MNTGTPRWPLRHTHTHTVRGRKHDKGGLLTDFSGEFVSQHNLLHAVKQRFLCGAGLRGAHNYREKKHKLSSTGLANKQAREAHKRRHIHTLALPSDTSLHVALNVAEAVSVWMQSSKEAWRMEGDSSSMSAMVTRKRKGVPCTKKQSHTRDTVLRGRHLTNRVCAQQPQSERGEASIDRTHTLTPWQQELHRNRQCGGRNNHSTVQPRLHAKGMLT